MIARTLIIRAEPLEKILDGRKDWEIRSRPASIRGRIALSEKGANAIVATCTLSSVVGPLPLDDVFKNARRIGLARPEIEADLAWWRRQCRKQQVYAWVLRDVRRLRRRVAFANPPGAVTWAGLPESIGRRLR